VRRTVKAFALLVLCLVICLKLAGCGSDSCGPESCQCGVSLETIWPNDDGRGWEYEYTWRTWDDTCEAYTNVEDVPPAPSLDEIEKLLGKHPIGDNVTTRVGTYKMKFDGDSTTLSGATAQALRDSAYLPEGAQSTRLSQIQITPKPILIHGGAWEKTDTYIGTYGDIDTLLAWKFLEANLCPGSEFEFRVSVSGVRVRCRILGETSVQTEMGSFENGLDCLYLVDLGVMGYGTGDVFTHYKRHITYGNVIYVPEVGPVYSYERFYVCVRDTLSHGAGDMELDLTATGKY
jgi:hypothetical protein